MLFISHSNTAKKQKQSMQYDLTNYSCYKHTALVVARLLAIRKFPSNYTVYNISHIKKHKVYNEPLFTVRLFCIHISHNVITNRTS